MEFAFSFKIDAMKRYPRSFLQLVTFSHLIVTLPLLALGLYAVLTLDRLSSRYESAIQSVSQSGRLSGELVEDVHHMDRNLRRHEILQTEETLADYEAVRGDWHRHMEDFVALGQLPVLQLDDLRAQIALEEQAHSALIAEKNYQKAHAAIDEIRTRTDRLQDDVRRQIELDQAAIRQQSDDVSRHFNIALGAALGLALLSIWLIRRLLSRLIGRFERAVLALGRGDLQKPILLDGPGDLRWLGRWLEWLRKRLISLEEGRAQVLRHMSHELKTPLVALQEGSALLAEQVPGPLTAAQSKILGIVQNNARRLQELIEGLLRLQQAGHAAERIGYEQLPCAEIVEQVVDTHRLIAQERNIDFVMQLDTFDIVAGREALLTIVHNLVSNAVKFSPAGGEIRVSLQRDGDRAVLDVVDEGPGIPEKDRAHLFEPFFRGSASRQIAGVGLGLAIAREFVLAHRGDIEIITGEAPGAHFRVRLPLAAPYLRKLENV